MNNNNSMNLSKINTSLFENNGASMANSYRNGFNANLQMRAAEMENEGNSSSNNGSNSVSGGRRRRARKTRRHSKAKRHTRHYAKGKKSRKNRKH